MIKLPIVNGHATPGDVGCIYIDEIVFPRHINSITVPGQVCLAVVEDSPVSLLHEEAKPLFKWTIPGGFVAKRAFNFCKPQVKVPAVEQVKRPLDDARLAQGKKARANLYGSVSCRMLVIVWSIQAFSSSVK